MNVVSSTKDILFLLYYFMHTSQTKFFNVSLHQKKRQLSHVQSGHQMELVDPESWPPPGPSGSSCCCCCPRLCHSHQDEVSTLDRLDVRRKTLQTQSCILNQVCQGGSLKRPSCAPAPTHRGGVGKEDG